MQFASTLYWEQSPTVSVPVILTLDGDRIELVTDSGAGLDSPAAQVVVHRALGRFTLECEERSFTLTAREGRNSPPMMPETTRRLRRFRAAHPDMPQPSARLIRQWGGYLEAVGAEMRGPTAERQTALTVAMIAAPLVLIALIFVAYAAGLRP